MRDLIHEKRKLFWCAAVLVIGIAAAFIVPRAADRVKFETYIEEEALEELISFGYGGDRSVSCYVAGEGREDDGDAYVFFPSFADLTNISVTTVAPKIVFTDEDGDEISVEGSAARVCSFEDDGVYTLDIYGADGEIVMTGTVTFMKSANLPTVYVTTDSGSMEDIDADKDYAEEGYLEIVDVDGSGLYVSGLTAISARGNQTFSYEKKSYHISLEYSQDLFGMGSSDSWILLSNVFDVSYVRNKTAYEMALQADMYGSTESTYVDVYLNGAYNGMYLLCEKIEVGANRLELNDLEADNEALLGGMETAYQYETEDGTRKGVESAVSPDDITGGYLIEHDYAEKYTVEVSGFTTDSGEQFVINSPEYATQDEVDYIADLMQEIEDAIKAEDGVNPDTGKHFTEYIDLESWADKFLVEEISMNNAGGLTSSYFYKFDDSVSTLVYGGPVWDFDKAFGRVEGFTRNTRSFGVMMYHENGSTKWFYYLWKHEEFVEAVKKEYEEKFSEYLALAAEVYIDEYIDLISESADMDIARFLTVYGSYSENADYEEKADYVRQFLLERKEFLDEFLLSDAQSCRVRFYSPDMTMYYCIYVIEGESIGELPDSVPGGTVAAWQIISDGTEYLTGDTVITEDLDVVAQLAESDENQE